MKDEEKMVVACEGLDEGLARDNVTLLRVNDIPAKVENSGEAGWAVLVPEDFLDDAALVLESQAAYEDLYGMEPGDDEDDEWPECD